MDAGRRATLDTDGTTSLPVVRPSSSPPRSRSARLAGLLTLALSASSLALASATCNHDWASLEPTSTAAGGAAGTSSSSAGVGAAPADAGTDASSCPPPSPGDLCSAVPQMPDPSAAGLSDYPFCLLPATTLDASNAAVTLNFTDAGPTDQKATIRVGWSSEGLHFQVHVDDAHVLPSAADDYLWDGDCVEIFAKGDNVTTGTFDGMTRDRGAVQVLVSAPAADGTVRGGYFFDGPSLMAQPIDPKDYAGRLVPGGWEIYVLVRWDVLRPAAQDASAPAPPAAGQRIALDFALDVKDDSAGASRDLQFTYANLPIQGAPACNPTKASCDDRLWCTATLE